MQEYSLGRVLLFHVAIGQQPAWSTTVDRVGNINGRHFSRDSSGVDRAGVSCGVAVLDPHHGAAIDISEAGIVLQHQITVDLLGLSIGTKSVTVAQGSRSCAAQVQVSKIIRQLAVPQVAAQDETVVEIVSETTTDIGAFHIVEVVARLTEEFIAVIFPVCRVAATVGGALGLEVIHHERCRGIGRRRPGQAAHEELIVVLRVIVLTITVLELAGETISQGLIRIQHITDVDAGFLVVEGTVSAVDLTELLEARFLGHKVHRTTWVGCAKQRGVGATQNFNALEGERVFANTAHGTQCQTVAIGGRLEATNLEVVVAVIAAVVVGDHAWRVLQEFFCGVDAALLDFLLGHHGNRGRGIEDAGGDLAADPELLGNHRTGVITCRGLGVDDNWRQAEGFFLCGRACLLRMNV